MKAAYATLGCKVSRYETQSICEMLEKKGFQTVPFTEVADVYIINSCTVTSTADSKSLQTLRRARRLAPDAVTVLCGCVPQAVRETGEGEKAADIVCGTVDREKLPDLIEEFLKNGNRIVDIKDDIRHEEYEDISVSRLDEHTRAYIKIEDGCDRFCTYCLIPFARGNIRSRRLESVVDETRRLTQNGYREIVLTGINLSAYNDKGSDLAEAVRVTAESGAERVRLGSLEPELLTEDMIDRLSKIPQLCRQFHISLQSGSEATLRRMGRRYTPEEYEEIVNRLRRKMPDCTVTTDIMVAFPGETEEEFKESLAFAEKIGFSHAHVFVYSPRKGTAAAKMGGRIDRAVGRKRSKILTEALHKSSNARLEGLVNRTAEALALEFDGENTHCVARDGTEILVEGNWQGIFTVKYIRPAEGYNVMAAEVI